jgi:hypothetical protein
MQYNYHCNRVVILNLELVQFWLFLAAFGTPLTWSFPIKKKPNTFIYITINIYDILSFEELSFQSTFNKKLFLIFDLYLSPDKLARKIYFCCRFYVRVGRVGHGNSTPLHWYIKQTPSMDFAMRHDSFASENNSITLGEINNIRNC